MTQLILASASEGRKELLSYLQIPFEIIPSTLDEEKIVGKNPLETVKLRARLKGKNVFNKLLKNPRAYSLVPSAYLILSADSGVIIDNQLIGKPKDYQEAKEIFMTLSGKTHEFVTAVYIIKSSKLKVQNAKLSPRQKAGDPAKAGQFRIQKGEKWENYEKSYVTFRKLTEQDIKRYLSVTNYTKYAGGYAISSTQDFITNIKGSISNVIGLPLEKVIPVLRENKLL